MQKIIFIQGIKTSPKYQKYMESKFENLGFECINFPMYYDLHDYEKFYLLKNNIEKAIFNSEPSGVNNKFILVAHSMGGILAMSLNKSCYKKVSKIITISSPHQVNTSYMNNLKVKLNYDKNLKESLKEENSEFKNLEIYTIGFYLDKVVLRKNTIYPNNTHKNFLADHGLVLFLTNFLLENILRFSKIV